MKLFLATIAFVLASSAQAQSSNPSAYERLKQMYSEAAPPASFQEVLETIAYIRDDSRVLNSGSQCDLFDKDPSKGPQKTYFDAYKIILTPKGPLFPVEESLTIINERGDTRDQNPANHVQILNSTGLFIEKLTPRYSGSRTYFNFRKKDGRILFIRTVLYNTGYEEEAFGYCHELIK